MSYKAVIASACLCGLAALFAAPAAAGQGDMAMERYEDAQISVDMPKGWATSRVINNQVLLIQEDPNDSEASNILLRRSPGVGPVDRETVKKFLSALVAGVVVDDGAATPAGGGGEVLLFRQRGEDVRIAMANLPTRDNAETIVAFLAATDKSFKALDGVDFIYEIASSVDGVDVSAVAAAPAKAQPAATLGNESGVVGAWIVSMKDLNLFSGPVSVALGGGATTAEVTANLGQSAWGTKLQYEFFKNGTYKAHYKGLSVFGVMRSEISSLEKGGYAMSGGVLTLTPSGYTGTISVGHQANAEKMNERNLPKRRYKVGRQGDAMALVGPCADFQVEPYCKKSGKLNMRAVFPLKRTR